MRRWVWNIIAALSLAIAIAFTVSWLTIGPSNSTITWTRIESAKTGAQTVHCYLARISHASLAIGEIIDHLRLQEAWSSRRNIQDRISKMQAESDRIRAAKGHDGDPLVLHGQQAALKAQMVVYEKMNQGLSAQIAAMEPGLHVNPPDFSPRYMGVPQARRDWKLMGIQYAFRQSPYDLHRQLTIPLWLVISLFLIIPILRCRTVVASKLGRQREIRGCCATCGYDLRASADRCPECGSAIAERTSRPLSDGVQGPLG